MAGTNYFSYFPTMEYACPESTDTKKVVDVFKRAKMVSMNKNIKGNIFYKYTIQDGERPEHIAERYYGDTQYYWIVLYANDIINLTAQWPRSYREFETYITGKYGSVEEASYRGVDSEVIHHYEDEDGDWITEAQWGENGALEEYKKTIYDYEYDLNESKREINIVRSEYLRQIIGEMNKIFKG